MGQVSPRGSVQVIWLPSCSHFVVRTALFSGAHGRRPLMVSTRVDKMSSKCPRNPEKGRENWESDSWAGGCKPLWNRNSEEFRRIWLTGSSNPASGTNFILLLRRGPDSIQKPAHALRQPAGFDRRISAHQGGRETCE